VSSLNAGPRIVNDPNAEPGVPQWLNEAARLTVTTGRNARAAQKFAYMWVTIMALYADTTPGAILEKMSKMLPTPRDQRALVRQLRERVTEEE
jgi:hypothetical protein